MRNDERAAPPAGYERLVDGDVDAVGLSDLADPLRRALEAGSFYEYAEHHPDARILQGRGIAYAVPLPESTVQVVVRRSRHGGLLAPLTGERFLGHTRAPRELETALRLERNGVATPRVIAYATYPDTALTRRADVLTAEVEGARDLAAEIMAAEGRALGEDLVTAVAALIASMTIAGARHPDINIKNILVTRYDGGAVHAQVIDVDRVWFDQPGSALVTERNLHRLTRSLHKWRRLHGLQVDDFDIQSIADAVDAILSDESGAPAASA
ncbi:MAG TPA: lipopolysaccharide kinase InaA family protein [Gemmatimonadaceae bacterium]|nr:lipopolysaccharide kinase InaA family protein [Gemmatimonadaceae bacterium]